MKNPKITIAISFKNPGCYFPLAIQSVFAQTFSDWELILMDDGSTDGSVEFARSLRDQRVRVYCDGRSFSQRVRLNQMVQLARSPYFARLDADDLMHPQRLAKQYQTIVNCDRQTIIGTAAYAIDQDSHIIGLRSSRAVQIGGYEARHSFISPSILGPTQWFRDNPFSDNPAYYRSEDAELWCRTTHHSRFINLPEPLLYYRESGVFSFDKYLGTSLGLLHLIHERYRSPQTQYFYLFGRELTKLGIAALFDRIGAANRLVTARSKPLTELQLRAGREGLAIVQQYSLPLSLPLCPT